MSLSSFVKKIRKRGIKNAYKYALLWWRMEKRARLLKNLGITKIPYPASVQIEITTACNLSCIMCEHTYWDEKPVSMSFNQFKQIVDQLPPTSELIITGIGSTFLNKDALKMIAYSKQKGFSVEFFDHLYSLNEDIIKELIKLQVNRVDMSLDGATAETYNKIRVGSDFDTVINNLKRFISLKQEFKSYYPEIYPHFVAMKQNIHEMPAFVELIHSLGLDTVLFARVFEFSGNKSCHIKDFEFEREMIKQAREKANLFGMNIFTRGFNPELEHYTKCPSPWNFCFITAAGDVFPCCAVNELNNRRIFRNFAMGNIFIEKFKDIWNSKKYCKFREDILKNKLPRICATCKYYSQK